MTNSRPTRRDLLTGRALQAQMEAGQAALASRVLDDAAGPPQAGPTARLTIRAMATEFGALLNPGPGDQMAVAMDALEIVHAVERQLTVYRHDSEVAGINARAAEHPVKVEPNLFELLKLCVDLTQATAGAFDVASHAQILLWKKCRDEGRLPSDDEITQSLASSGMSNVCLDAERQTVAFNRHGVGLNFGAIGKGYALDRCAELLVSGDIPEPPGHEGSTLDTEGVDPTSRDKDGGGTSAPIASFCLHGGHSSVLARGGHNGRDGWPVGIGNPLFTTRRLGTVLLRDQAMGTSGSNVQFFRYEGKRYGHILDPRTARPAGELLSVTVLAPTAAIADALSTAFFVLGVEKAREICDNYPLIGALLIPPPGRGGRLEPVAVGISEDILFLDPDQVADPR